MKDGITLGCRLTDDLYKIIIIMIMMLRAIREAYETKRTTVNFSMSRERGDC